MITVEGCCVTDRRGGEQIGFESQFAVIASPVLSYLRTSLHSITTSWLILVRTIIATHSTNTARIALRHRCHIACLRNMRSWEHLYRRRRKLYHGLHVGRKWEDPCHRKYRCAPLPFLGYFLSKCGLLRADSQALERL